MSRSVATAEELTRGLGDGLKEHLLTGEARRPIEDLVVPKSLRLSLMELTPRTCKWPHGDPTSPDFNFCGHDNHFEGPTAPTTLASPSPQNRNAR